MTYSDDTIITRQMARELMRRGACGEALGYVGMTVGRACERQPRYAILFAADVLTPERRAACEKAISQ
jgi:ActR/RegA family two-component response regulator